MKHIEVEGNGKKLVIICMDKLYIHQNHTNGETYLTKDEQKNRVNTRKTKGRRLIILNEISTTEPLVTREEDGFPVSDLS